MSEKGWIKIAAMVCISIVLMFFGSEWGHYEENKMLQNSGFEPAVDYDALGARRVIWLKRDKEKS